MSDQQVTIRPAVPGDTDAVLGLIVPIQREEFGIPISAADQPDLRDIAGFYQCGAGNFWVALHGGQVVGTIALLDIGAGQAALRKMFVQAGARGTLTSVAHGCSRTLLAWAGAHGLRPICSALTAVLAAPRSEARVMNRCRSCAAHFQPVTQARTPNIPHSTRAVSPFRAPLQGAGRDITLGLHAGSRTRCAGRAGRPGRPIG
ncbi:MAG: GNAT family N-acetyltransferase [Kouleothrix sp.]